MADVVDSCNVFIKYLPHEVTDSGLYAMFSPFGEVVSCKVMLDNITKNSLGYGFVTAILSGTLTGCLRFCRYSNPAEAQAAVEKMSGVKCGQKTLLCKLSNSSPGPNMSTNLYVKPLLATTTEGMLFRLRFSGNRGRWRSSVLSADTSPLYSGGDSFSSFHTRLTLFSADLRHLFSQFGEILECKVMTDKGVNSTKQVGFVRFANVQEATIAIKQMNGYQLDADAPQLVGVSELISDLTVQWNTRRPRPRRLCVKQDSLRTRQQPPRDTQLPIIPSNNKHRPLSHQCTAVTPTFSLMSSRIPTVT